MASFPSYGNFKAMIRQGYLYGEVDELTHQEGHGYWLDRGMYRWYRLCKAINETYPGEAFSLLDIGAYPFTALKVAKVVFPETKLLGAGFWDRSLGETLTKIPFSRMGSSRSLTSIPG